MFGGGTEPWTSPSEGTEKEFSGAASLDKVQAWQNYKLPDLYSWNFGAMEWHYRSTSNMSKSL